jgi:hypothetical protein
VKANATDLPPPAPVASSAEAVTALYRAHALGVISGNSFTPIPGQGNSTADQSGAW